MRDVLGFIQNLLALALLAAKASGISDSQDSLVHPTCRSANCREIASTSDGFLYKINGRGVIVNFKDGIQFNLWCNSDGGAEDVLLSADDPDLPMLSRRVTVEKAIFNGCLVPNSTYYDALNAFNITVTKKLFLQLPAEPKLEKDHLRGLQITYLEITAVEPTNPPRPSFDYLNELPGLTTLKLSNVVPEPEALMYLPAALETLNFVYARLHVAEHALRNGSNVLPPWLERLRSLRSLYLVELSADVEKYSGAVVTLPHLNSLPNLTSVSLYHVPLNKNELPNWLKGTALKNLVLRSCGLTVLPETMFEGANITKINLTYNNLTYLPDFVFSPLQLSLRELDLSNNNMDGTSLKRSLAPLRQLETLKVNKNPLGSLCGGGGVVRAAKSSSNLPKTLRRLELSSTHATLICSDWVENVALMNIDLSNNDIEDLTFSDLEMKRKFNETLVSPVTLNLSNNPLRFIEVSHSNVQRCLSDASLTSDDPDIPTRTKVKIKLSGLACDCDDYWLYEALRQCSLLELDDDVACVSKPVAPLHKTLLDYNPDDFLCPYDEACLPECSCRKRPRDNATLVRCAGALPPEPHWPPAAPGWPLALHVAPGTLAAVPRVMLVELHAPNNNITTLDVDDIPNTLRVLDVRNNSISRVSLAAAQLLGGEQAIKKNLSVHLAGNQLACDCVDASAFDLLKRVVLDWNTTQCVDLSYVSGKTKNDLCTNLLLPIVFGVIVPVLIMVVAALILQRLLPHVKQFLFQHNLCLGWILSVNDNVNDPDKTHDVFLSYAYDDLERLNELKAGLEKLGYSTIEHCRDWQPGDAVMEQITRSVLCARRTVLLVSDSYAKSKWALEEFHAAHAHAMERRTARVVIVRCGLQKPEVLPSDLKLYLNNHTYLAWEDPKFWYKLCRDMPPLGQEHKSVLFAAVDMEPPFSKYDKDVPFLQLSLEPQLTITQCSATVPGAC